MNAPKSKFRILNELTEDEVHGLERPAFPALWDVGHFQLANLSTSKGDSMDLCNFQKKLSQKY